MGDCTIQDADPDSEWFHHSTCDDARGPQANGFQDAALQVWHGGQGVFSHWREKQNTETQRK